MTLNYAYDPQHDEASDREPAEDVAAAIAVVAELMHGIESGALPPSAATVVRLQQATANLEALVARLP